MKITHLAVFSDLTTSIYFLQKRSKGDAKNEQNSLNNDKQEEMKESKAVYVNKHKIRDDQQLVYHLQRSERDELFPRADNKTYNSNFSCQYNSKIDNEICTCKNVITLRKHQEIKYYSGLPKQIYAYHGARDFTDVGVGSVKALPKKNVKKIYLPETDDRGVGSSNLFTFISRSRQPKEAANNSCYYDHKRTSSKCVGGILEYNNGCVVNQKLSPIVQTKSGCTSPKYSCELKSTEIGSNIVYKKLESIGTQFGSKESEKLEVKAKVPAALEVETKPVKKVSEQTQKSKYSNEITEDKKKPEVGKRAKEVIKNFSSDSLVQHIHNLENPSEDKHSRTSFPDPMENKLEREYRKMFSTTKSKDSKPSFQRPLTEFKSVSLLKRRFDALRRGMHKKNSNLKKIDSIMISTDAGDSYPTHKDASVSSDPPSLISRSISNSKKYSPVVRSVEKDRNKDISYKNEKYSEQWPQNASDISEGQGVKGMFKLWGKKFNFEDEANSKRRATPMPSYNTDKKPEKVVKPKVETPTKKEGKKFFFFKKKSKDKPSQPYKSKKNVTAGRCEIGDGLTLKLGGNTRNGQVSTILEEDNEITRKTWLKKFLSKTIESARSVNIRWNNIMYATSSSTILELLDTVYTNAGVVFKSRSEITTEESSFYKSFNKPKVNFVRDIEAWMIPKTIPDRPMKQMPVNINPNKENKQKNIEIAISNQKWFVDKSEAFSNKIEVVLNSDNCNILNNNKISSEYLKINIPKDFFDSITSIESKRQAKPVIQRNHWSDEEVYKIVEYETNSEIKSGNEAATELEKGDFTSHDIEVIVSFQDSRSLESKILETVIKRPMHRDVVIQGSIVNVPKRCDVIGVGIITQRDLREIRKPILKIQDVNETDEESDSAKWPNQKKSEFAESFLQEYYRHWIPLGTDLYSSCVSVSHLRSCSERSILSYCQLGFVGDVSVTKSCPDMSDGLQSTTIESSGEISSTYNTNEDQRAEPDNCTKKLLNILKKNALGAKTEMDTNYKRILPKDSVEVFKRRKMYAASNKSHWIGSTAAQDNSAVVSSIDSIIGAQKKALQQTENNNNFKSKKNPIKKHVSMKHVSDNNPELSLQFKEKECKICKKNGSKCSKHAVVKPVPPCEISQPPCKASCESMKEASCSKPVSPSCNISRQSPVRCDPCLPPSHPPHSRTKWPICTAPQNSSRVQSQTSLLPYNMADCSRSNSKCLGFVPEWAKTPRGSTCHDNSPSATPRTKTQSRDTIAIIYPCTSNPSPPSPPCLAIEELNASTNCKMCMGPATVLQKINPSVYNTSSSSGNIKKRSSPVSPRSSYDSLKSVKHSVKQCCNNPKSEECKKCCIDIHPQVRQRSPPKEIKRLSPPRSIPGKDCSCCSPSSDNLKKKSLRQSPEKPPLCDFLPKKLSPSTSQPSQCLPSKENIQKRSSPPHLPCCEACPYCNSPPPDNIKKKSPPQILQRSPCHLPEKSSNHSPVCNEFNKKLSPRTPQANPHLPPKGKKMSSPPSSLPCEDCSTSSTPSDNLKKKSSLPSPSCTPQISSKKSMCHSSSHCDILKKISPPHTPHRSPRQSPKRSPCNLPNCDKEVCQDYPWPTLPSPSRTPEISGKKTMCHSSSPCNILKKMSSPPHTPHRSPCHSPKRSPCNLPNCDKELCQDIPWPINNQIFNPPTPKESDNNLPQPKKYSNKCDKQCSMISKEQEQEQKPKSCMKICPPCVPQPPTVSGIHLKMKKKLCSDKCSSWNSSEQLQGVVRLNSREIITIKLREQTPSVQEIRKPIYRKMVDEDGQTICERKDYTYENHRSSVLNDMYRDSKINRVSAPAVTNVSEDIDHKETSTADVINQSLDNLIEIQFKLRIAQGDKTTDIKIGNENEGKHREKTESWKDIKNPDIYVVNSATEEITREVDPKNDIDIKIIVRNYRPKNNIKFRPDHKEFSKKISDKFHAVSTGYSNVNVDPSAGPVFSVHTATVNLSSSAEKSKTQSKISKEVTSTDLTKNDNEPNLTFSSLSTEQLPTDVTEDEITEGKSISSKKDSQSEKFEEISTIASELPDFNDTDDQDAAALLAHTSDECNVKDVISQHTSKQMKKKFLKKVMEKADRSQGNNESVRQLKDVLKIILTDSSENEDWNVTCNEITDDVTYISLNSNSFRNADSMNNHEQGSLFLSTQAKIEAIYPTVENNSIDSKSNSSNSGANYDTYNGCMCRQLAEKLNQNNISCCCRQKNKNDEETTCDIKNEYVDVEVQNSKCFTPKVDTLNVSVHSKSFAKNGHIKIVDETEILHSPTNKMRRLKHYSSKKIKEYEIKKLNTDTLLGISDDDKVIVLCQKSTKLSRVVCVDAQDTKTRKKIESLTNPESDILQSYEAKKAVLEIYAEKAEDGKHLVAKLPRFVAEKESEIVRNYAQIATNSYKSVCKENIVVMSVRR